MLPIPEIILYEKIQQTETKQNKKKNKKLTLDQRSYGSGISINHANNSGKVREMTAQGAGSLPLFWLHGHVYYINDKGKRNKKVISLSKHTDN